MKRGLRFTLLPTLILALSVAVSTQQARLLVNVHSESGDPLPGARFDVLYEDGGALAATCRTDASGGCVLVVAPLQDYVVRASFSGYDGSRISALTPAAGDTRVSFTLYPAMREPWPEPDDSVSIVDGLISGAVRSITDEPLPDVWVHARSSTLIFHGSSFTGKDGSFQMRVPPGTYAVASNPNLSTPTSQYIDAAAYGAPVNVVSGLVNGPVILYPRAVTLPSVNLIAVTDTGRAVAGAEILHSTDGPIVMSMTGGKKMMAGRMTGPNGAVLIPVAPPGTMTITATGILEGRELAGIATAEVRDAPLDIVVTLRAAAQVTGRVEFIGRTRPLHDSEGGLRVFPSPGAADGFGYSPADPNGLVGADGQFVLKGLIGERCLVLRNVPSGWRLVETTYYGRPFDGKPLLFQPGERVDGVVFRIEPATSEDQAQSAQCVVKSPGNSP